MPPLPTTRSHPGPTQLWIHLTGTWSTCHCGHFVPDGPRVATIRALNVSHCRRLVWQYVLNASKDPERDLVRVEALLDVIDEAMHFSISCSATCCEDSDAFQIIVSSTLCFWFQIEGHSLAQLLDNNSFDGLALWYDNPCPKKVSEASVKYGVEHKIVEHSPRWQLESANSEETSTERQRRMKKARKGGIRVVLGPSWPGVALCSRLCYQVFSPLSNKKVEKN